MIFYRKFCRKFYRKSYTMSINNEQIPLLSVSYNTSLGTSNDIDNNENNENNENNNENQLLVSSSELNNHITNSENRCFICLENIAEVNHKYYCNCNGYISYVHCECLKNWISEDFSILATPVIYSLSLGVLASSVNTLIFTLFQGIGRPDITTKQILNTINLFIT